MATTDYLMNVALIALVVLQIRGHKVTRARLFLRSVPTEGNDLVLIVGLAAIGAALGAAAGVMTTVRREGPGAWAQAGVAAAALWVVGIGARMGFAMWVSHGGQAAVAHFS